jgi:hypothetical protein
VLVNKALGKLPTASLSTIALAGGEAILGRHYQILARDRKDKENVRK